MKVTNIYPKIFYCAVNKEVDYAWQHGKAIERINSSKPYVECIYCGHVVQGITRLKYHLAKVKGIIKVCEKVPEVVFEGFRENFHPKPGNPEVLILKVEQIRVPQVPVAHEDQNRVPTVVSNDVI